MSTPNLEQALLDLPNTGRLIKDRAYRQVWRFEFAGKPYYLKFYPAAGLRNWVRRRFRGSPAMREFQRLQMLQRAGVPSPRAVAALMGFKIRDTKGDAVILEGIEPSIQLDKHLNRLEIDAQPMPDHRHLARQLIDLLEKLGKAKLGHSDLHLGNFLLHNNKLHLLDGYAVHRGGLKMDDLFLLATSAHPYATRTDLHRAWKQLGPGSAMPEHNPRARSIWRSLLNRAFHNDRYFGHLDSNGWSGHFFRHAKFPHRWSTVSRMDISQQDWQTAWPLLLKQIESDQLEVLKRSRSGDVLAGEVILNGRPVPIVIKRPRRKFWYRYINEIGRGSRPRRAWKKAWQLVIRNIPTAWPMLMMEKRRFGYVTDAMVIFERIEGETLSSPKVRNHGPDAYHTLLFRVGRLLRRLEDAGLYLYDSKADNWIIREDPKLGLIPIIIDVDGVRSIRQGGGIERLQRSLRQLPAFTPTDAQVVFAGYSPGGSSQ
ncbi:MAG TPA: lipopolysaccharide kinase InaA family protein [Tepidisphaeraceae bacterium]|nr:lipopolysaccharide kinase InaA family protein [Tepidisphaeraceae bacterium]